MPHFHRCPVCENEEGIYCEIEAWAEYCPHHDHDSPLACADCEEKAKGALDHPS